MSKTLSEDSLYPIIRLFKDEFSNEVWIQYCHILGIDKEVAENIVSVELQIKKVLPQIN